MRHTGVLSVMNVLEMYTKTTKYLYLSVREANEPESNYSETKKTKILVKIQYIRMKHAQHNKHEIIPQRNQLRHYFNRMRGLNEKKVN